MTVSVDAEPKSFLFYKSGVYRQTQQLSNFALSCIFVCAVQ